MLKAGANVNTKDGWALRDASYEGHLAVVRELLKAGADPMKVNLDKIKDVNILKELEASMKKS